MAGSCLIIASSLLVHSACQGALDKVTITQMIIHHWSKVYHILWLSTRFQKLCLFLISVSPLHLWPRNGNNNIISNALYETQNALYGEDVSCISVFYFSPSKYFSHEHFGQHSWGKASRGRVALPRLAMIHCVCKTCSRKISCSSVFTFVLGNKQTNKQTNNKFDCQHSDKDPNTKG